MIGYMRSSMIPRSAARAVGGTAVDLTARPGHREPGTAQIPIRSSGT
jgi:hypothetical protein